MKEKARFVNCERVGQWLSETSNFSSLGCRGKDSFQMTGFVTSANSPKLKDLDTLFVLLKLNSQLSELFIELFIELFRDFGANICVLKECEARRGRGVGAALNYCQPVLQLVRQVLAKSVEAQCILSLPNL